MQARTQGGIGRLRWVDLFLPLLALFGMLAAQASLPRLDVGDAFAAFAAEAICHAADSTPDAPAQPDQAPGHACPLCPVCAALGFALALPPPLVMVAALVRVGAGAYVWPPALAPPAAPRGSTGQPRAPPVPSA